MNGKLINATAALISTTQSISTWSTWIKTAQSSSLGEFLLGHLMVTGWVVGKANRFVIIIHNSRVDDVLQLSLVWRICLAARAPDFLLLSLLLPLLLLHLDVTLLGEVVP